MIIPSTFFQIWHCDCSKDIHCSGYVSSQISPRLLPDSTPG